MEENKLASAIAENRCAICGTEHGKQIKVVNEIYFISITIRNSVPICNLCLAHYPENIIAQDLDFTHLTWMILQKRLHQQDVFNKVCKNRCGTPIVTARKEKEFCSNNCRAKYWQKQAKKDKSFLIEREKNE